MKKIVALILCVVMLNCFCVSTFAATQEQTEAPVEYELEIDVEKRYTNISEMDDYHKTFLDVEDEEEETKESRKMIYIVILSILLVVAIVILVVSLKRVPAVDENDNKDEEDLPESTDVSSGNTDIITEEKDSED